MKYYFDNLIFEVCAIKYRTFRLALQHLSLRTKDLLRILRVKKLDRHILHYLFLATSAVALWNEVPITYMIYWLPMREL